MQAMQRRMTQFSRDGRPEVRPPLRQRLVMGLPPVAELQRRLIWYGGWRPERVRDLPWEERQSPRTFAAHLASKTASSVWGAMAQIDPRAMLVLGAGIYPYDMRPQGDRRSE
jgi:hypothetical protein